MANISKNIREARLRWLGHVERKTNRCSNDNMEVTGHRKIFALCTNPPLATIISGCLVVIPILGSGM